MTSPPALAPSVVILVASDGTEFVLPVDAAKRSGFVARILYADKVSAAASGGGGDSAAIPAAASRVRLELPDFSPAVLDLICHFLCESHQRAVARPHLPPLDMSNTLSCFDPTLASDRTVVMELMVAAEYLAC
jgi:hypothetical protein